MKRDRGLSAASLHDTHHRRRLNKLLEVMLAKSVKEEE